MNIKRKTVRNFISDLVQQCTKEQIEFKLTNTNKINLSGIPCNGYFEGTELKGKLIVATNKPQKDWLPILVHESCHLDQWLEDKQKFIKLDSIGIIDKWLNGEKIKKTELIKAFRASKKLELDCEKRSIIKIKKYNLPINIEEYIQMANSYIYFYNWVLENRKWVSKNKTLYTKEIYKLAPKEFQSSYNKTPENLNEAFNLYL